jgi:signal peptidase II
MRAPSLARHLAAGVSVAAVAVVDQLVKLAVQHSLPLGIVLPVIPGLFNLTHIQNPGAAFGLFAGLPAGVRKPLLIGVSVVAIGLLLYLYSQLASHDRLPRVAIALILGGALGNLYERVRFGAVVDYLDVFLGQYHWPAFNLADAAITVGTGILVLSTLRPPGAPDSLPTHGKPRWN